MHKVTKVVGTVQHFGMQAGSNDLSDDSGKLLCMKHWGDVSVRQSL